MRNGYWNSSTRRGWGWYKMYFKHELARWDVWETTVDMTCGHQEGDTTTWRYYASFVRQICDNSGCETVDRTTVKSVVQRRMFDGERKGMITTYCIDRDPCPAWLNDYNRFTTSAPSIGFFISARPATENEIANDVVNDTTEYADVDDRGAPIVEAP